MNDIESIIIYGFAGYVIITDFYLFIFGVIQKSKGYPLGLWGESYSIFFARKFLGLVTGLALIVAYRSETVGFFWSLMIFSFLSLPEAGWLIYRSMKAKEMEDDGKTKEPG